MLLNLIKNGILDIFLLYVAMYSVLYERKASSWMAWLDNLIAF